MIVGLDLDNTIVDCDASFRKQSEIFLDRDLTHLSRETIRDLVRKERGDHYWTQIQAEVYGPLYIDCKACTGALDVIANLAASPRVTDVLIISHKTLTDSAGKNYKLRDYALTWIERNLLSNKGPLTASKIHFAGTIEEKRQMIVDKNCTIFLDDLQDIVVPLQGKIASPVLYSAQASQHPMKDQLRVCDWPAFQDFVLHG